MLIGFLPVDGLKTTATEAFRKLTSGKDPINAEFKNQNSFEYINYAKLTFSANKIPKMSASISMEEFEAVMIRWLLVHFPTTYRGTANEDPNLLKKLTTKEELSGFFNLAISGFKRLNANNKFSNSKSIEEIKKQYIILSDSVKAFADENLEINTCEKTRTDVMYEQYVLYCGENKIKEELEKNFEKSLEEIGYINKRTFSGGLRDYYWMNVEIKKVK